jgi:hypothetical protein
MKKTIVLLFVCILMTGFSGCINIVANSNTASGFNIGQTIKGNGILKEKEIGKLDFTAIDAHGSIDVILSSSSDAPVTVSGDENLIDYVEVSVISGTLTVRNREGFSYSTKLGLKVIAPNNGKIEKIAVSGSSDLIAESALTGEKIYVTCKGSSDFKGDISTRKCELNMSGSSDYKGNLKVEDAKLVFSGSSDFIGALEAKYADISGSGSSDFKITGFAETCRIAMSGSSDFKGYDFTALKVDCFASGSSDIKITCSEEISVKAKGSSDVYYRGKAQVVSKSLSGSSDLYNK